MGSRKGLCCTTKNSKRTVCVRPGRRYNLQRTKQHFKDAVERLEEAQRRVDYICRIRLVGGFVFLESILGGAEVG